VRETNCYSGKLLVSLKDDRRNIATEIARVKSLSHPSPWLADMQEDGKVFEHDKTSKLKGIGAKSEEKLSKNRITTLKRGKKSPMLQEKCEFPSRN
jgi:hypothetical protein